MANLEKVVDLLESGGVLTRLESEAQQEREQERTAVLLELTQTLATDEKLGKTLAVDIQKATASVAKAEADLQAARASLNELTSQHGAHGIRAEKLRGKLRRLADPAIGEAITRLHALHSKARAGFSTRPHGVLNRLTGHRTEETHSNAAVIADILSRIRLALGQLEALQEAPRPENLAEVLTEIERPILADVRAQSGL